MTSMLYASWYKRNPCIELETNASMWCESSKFRFNRLNASKSNAIEYYIRLNLPFNTNRMHYIRNYASPIHRPWAWTLDAINIIIIISTVIGGRHCAVAINIICMHYDKCLVLYSHIGKCKALTDTHPQTWLWFDSLCAYRIQICNIIRNNWSFNGQCWSIPLSRVSCIKCGKVIWYLSCVTQHCTIKVKVSVQVVRVQKPLLLLKYTITQFV